MFPNGYNMPFYSSYNVPGMAMGMGMGPAIRNGGLLSRLTGANSLRTGIGTARSINWSGLLNNASKTLGVINQAIPVVKQVGPMYNNMKSMLKIASLFKDETDPVQNKTNTNRTNNSNTNKTTINEEKENTTTNNSYSNSPNFFI